MPDGKPGGLKIFTAPPAAPAPKDADSDPNAEWLTLAHMICTDAGVPPGHITQRLEVLRGLLAAQPVAAPLTDEQIYAIAGPADYFDRRVFARAIEKAHGIGITAAAQGAQEGRHD